MEIGIFTSVFNRPNLAATLDAVLEQGIHNVQFNLECAGLSSMPDVLDTAQLDAIRRAFAERQISMTAVSGTFNIIHPDHHERADGMRRLRTLAAGCQRLGTSVITLCTGTRDTQSMWRAHPENNTPEAWQELLVSMRQIAEIGAEYQVVMAFEPEVNNVVDSAHKARLLIDTIGSPLLKVVMDAANIFHTGELPNQHAMVAEACQLLGKDIAFAHAKDLDHDGDAGHLAAGEGLLDYNHYLHQLQRVGYQGPLILHGLSEAQAPACVAFLRAQLRDLAG